MSKLFGHLIPHGRGQRSDADMIDQRESFDTRSRAVDTHSHDIPHVHMRITASAATTVVAGTPIKLAGVTEIHDSHGWVMAGNNCVRYTYSVGRHSLFITNMTTTSDTNNTIVKFYYAKNGAVIEGS